MITKLAGSARTRFDIADGYLTVDVLARLLPHLGRDVSVRVVVDPKFRASYRKRWSDLKSVHTSIGVRFARTFHDRFVLLDGQECWHFGHSVSGQGGDRVWRYQKVFSLEEATRLIGTFETTWLGAEDIDLG